MDSLHSQALTSLLVMDFLKKEGVSSHLLNNLSNELSHKGVFKSMITLNGEVKPSSYYELDSQVPVPETNLLKTMVHHQYLRQKEGLEIKQKRDTIIENIRQKHEIFDIKKRRSALIRRPSLRNLRPSFEVFPTEIFTEYWGKLKTIYGHMKRIPDPEDPLNGSPVYNLVYDKTGKLVITAGDDGYIKLWNTANGELVNTFMGHNADINAISLSECGNYLASCSNDSLVRVWHLETGYPIAVFSDHEGTICSLSFFNIPIKGKAASENLRGLASASDDGTIMIYFERDYLNNGGILRKNQEKMKLKADEAVKGFCSIEIHPEGFIAAGTSAGSVVIWNRLSEIETRRIERHRIIKHAHSKDCHLTVWSKDGTRLISASFDGTAKIWPWNKEEFEENRAMEPLFVFEGEVGSRGNDIKCCAVAWSCKGRYVVASFCKKLKKSTEDNDFIRTNIQVFDFHQYQRTHKFENSYDGTLFENYIFILEAHPYNEAIIMSADYDGKIIIWNIEIGQMINCFVEDCTHLGFPLCQAPILDGKFSPDGLSFCVSNYHGSLSMYGYGERDLYITTPIEQFLQKEFEQFDLDNQTFQAISFESGLDMHIVEKGPLCSSKKKPYSNDYISSNFNRDFDESTFYEKYLKALHQKRFEPKPVNEGLNTEACVKALKEKIKGEIQTETQQALKQFYTELTSTEDNSKDHIEEETDENNKKMRAKYLGKTQIQKIIKPPKMVNFELEDKPDYSLLKKGLLLDSEIKNNQDLSIKSMKYASDLLEEDENNNPMRDSRARNQNQDREFEMEEETSGVPRRRRIRKIIVDDEEEEDEDQEEKIMQTEPAQPATSKKLQIEEEEEEKKVQPQKEKPQRNRKLILDDDDEGENLFGEEPALKTSDQMQEEPKTQAQPQPQDTMENPEIAHENSNRSEITLTRTLSRDILGRRNRTLATNLANREVMNSQRAQRARNRAAQIEQQEAEQAAEEVMCTRCGQENARILCKYDCGRAYHTACSKRHGRENERGVFTCFSCLSANRKKEKIVGSRVNREWVDGDTVDPKKYIPQAGDLVVYAFQPHEDFVMEYFDYLRFSRGEIFPFENDLSLCHENVCKIVDITYQFPLAPKWYKQKLNVLMKITLEVVEPENIQGQMFAVSYFDCNLSDFLIPKDVYQKAINQSKHIPKDQQVKLRVNGAIKCGLLSEVTPREEGTFPDSPWKSLQFFDHSAEEGGYALRRSKKEQGENLIYASPWDLLIQDDSLQTKLVDPDMTKEFIDNVIKEIDTIHDSDTDRFDIFVEEVNKALYRDYPSKVAYEMNIDKIKTRLQNFFYRHKEGIISDIHLIKLNCHRYNDPKSEISSWASELTDKMTQAVDPNFQRKPRPPKPEPKPREIRKKPNLLAVADDEGNESAANRSPQTETYVTRSRAKRLQVVDPFEEEEKEEDTSYKSKLRRPAREVKSYTEEYDNPPAVNQGGGDGIRTRLRRGQRNVNIDEDFEEEEDNTTSLLRSKQRRKERETRDRYNRDLSDYSEEEEAESEESESEASITSYSQTRRRTGNTNNTRSRNRLRTRGKTTPNQYFEGDEDEISPENIEVAPRTRVKTERNSMAPAQVQQQTKPETRQTRSRNKQPEIPAQNIPRTQQLPSASHMPQQQRQTRASAAHPPSAYKDPNPFSTNLSINIPSDYPKSFQSSYSSSSSNYQQNQPSYPPPMNYQQQPPHYPANYANGGQFNKMGPSANPQSRLPTQNPSNTYPPYHANYYNAPAKPTIPPSVYNTNPQHYPTNMSGQVKITKPVMEPKETSNQRIMGYQAAPDTRYNNNMHAEFGNYAFVSSNLPPSSYEQSYPNMSNNYGPAPTNANYGQRFEEIAPQKPETKPFMSSSFEWNAPDDDPFRNLIYKDESKYDDNNSNSWNNNSH